MGYKGHANAKRDKDRRGQEKQLEMKKTEAEERNKDVAKIERISKSAERRCCEKRKQERV